MDACKALLSEVIKGGRLNFSAIKTKYSLLLGGKSDNQIRDKIVQLRNKTKPILLANAREATLSSSSPMGFAGNRFGESTAIGLTNDASESQATFPLSDTAVETENLQWEDEFANVNEIDKLTVAGIMADLASGSQAAFPQSDTVVGRENLKL